MTEPATKGRLAHIVRVTVCLLSMGFVFPHALMENIDLAKLAKAKEKALVADSAP